CLAWDSSLNTVLF
nr:immunoglobulin light chain junction region [Macaca mulatta]MPO05123.1 immunoglobulin light chain junction region [Macaca mulatta]MPO08335.1 immunoglobulin light chain junction region [Macaca mulatta]MPO08638.1 immunoglobulin light chain junction region [Macaca mulatta]MPO11458.1 immunoglobulin light chain junction region [Macaca mulatta]